MLDSYILLVGVIAVCCYVIKLLLDSNGSLRFWRDSYREQAVERQLKLVFTAEELVSIRRELAGVGRPVDATPYLNRLENLVRMIDLDTEGRITNDGKTHEKAGEAPDEDTAWIRLDRNGLRQHVQVSFWVLCHLRAIALLKEGDTNSNYLAAYQDGFKGDTIADWLACFSEHKPPEPPTELEVLDCDADE